MKFRFIVIWVSVSVILLSIFLFHLTRQLHTLNDEWNKVTAIELERSSILTEVQRSIGYTGFIHHFKNYILRRSDVYFDRAVESYQLTKSKLKHLSEQLDSEDEKANIQVVSDTLDEYYLKLQQAQSHWQGLPVNELDELVKVNDEPAKESLKQLRELIIHRFNNDYRSTLLKTQSLNQYTLISTLVIIPAMMVLSLMLYIFMKRFGKIFRENQTILESSPDGIISADEHGNVVKANKVARQIFGYDHDEFLTLKIEDLMDDKYKSKHIKNRENFVKQEQHRHMNQRDTRILGKTKSGEFIDLSITIASVFIDGKSRSIVITRDITSINHLEKEANLDYLTNTINRRAIDKCINDEMLRTKRYQRPLSIMIIDIDNFKQLNDQQGHLMGDKAIIHVAEFLKSSVRPSDKLGRWGGDEFLLVCPELNSQSALELAERIRTTFASLDLSCEHKMTLSIGIDTYEGDSDATINKLLTNADSALYHSKNKGKNQANVFA